MQLRVDSRAKRELFEAASFYEREVSGLGDDFLNEIEAAYRQIVAHPTAWREMTKGVRRFLVNRFPYGVYYKLGEDTVLVFAVLHLYRHPDAWKKEN